MFSITAAIIILTNKSLESWKKKKIVTIKKKNVLAIKESPYFEKLTT